MSEPQTHPHWQRMRFKNNKVWMAVTEQGAPLIKNGKSLIKFQLDQEHEYWVHPGSLKSVDDKDGVSPPSSGKNKSAQRRAKPKKEEQTPIVNSDASLVIFTDGACSGNPGPAGIGVVMRYKGHEKEISRYIGTATNNIAELEAIRTALLAVRNRKVPIVLYTDSSYALGLLTKNWKANQNQELVNDLRNLVKQFANLRLIKIRGHAGHTDNERADRLAVKALEKA